MGLLKITRTLPNPNLAFAPASTCVSSFRSPSVPRGASCSWAAPRRTSVSPVTELYYRRPVWFATRRGEVWVGLVASLRCWTQWLPHMGIGKRVRALRHYTFPLRLPLVQILRWVVIRPGTTPVITCTRYIESDGIRYSRCAGGPNFRGKSC